VTNPPRILIVEDERIVARMLQRKLARFGYAIAGVTAFGEEAVHMAALDRPDLVLMDIRLKGDIDGIQAATEIRTLDIPVVFLTAHADDETLRLAKVTEPFGYVLKPFQERELQIVIEMALYKHAAERDRHRLEEQARRVQSIAALGQLAGGIAHDFNNVLMVILNACAALVRESPELPTNRVTLIRTTAERAARMTRELLSFGRDQPRSSVVTDPGRLIHDMVAMLQTLIGEHVTIETRIASELRAIKTMPWHLEQMLLNLVVNARDAMPEGGVVTVTAENSGDPGSPPRVLLTVSDTGGGMDPETRRRIFEPYFTTKTTGEGTGIGLATVCDLVDRARGKIEVVSSVGKGSVFMIWLPASDEAPVARPDTPIDCRILVVEDDAGIRGIIRESLENAGARVLEAADGVEALQVSRAHDGPIDLVVSDVVMPRMSAAALSSQLAIDRPTTKVLYISGYPDAASTGAQITGPFLAKPFTRSELLCWIRSALDAHP
jgi:two-component system cell cycle sensor histidine kinase/response regulator CckA